MLRSSKVYFNDGFSISGINLSSLPFVLSLSKGKAHSRGLSLPFLVAARGFHTLVQP